MAARLFGLRVRVPPGEWMSVFCEYCVLSGRGLCDAPVTCAQEFCRVCVFLFARTRVCLYHHCVLVCDQMQQ